MRIIQYKQRFEVKKPLISAAGALALLSALAVGSQAFGSRLEAQTSASSASPSRNALIQTRRRPSDAERRAAALQVEADSLFRMPTETVRYDLVAINRHTLPLEIDAPDSIGRTMVVEGAVELHPDGSYLGITRFSEGEASVSRLDSAKGFYRIVGVDPVGKTRTLGFKPTSRLADPPMAGAEVSSFLTIVRKVEDTGTTGHPQQAWLRLLYRRAK